MLNTYQTIASMPDRTRAHASGNRGWAATLIIRLCDRNRGISTSDFEDMNKHQTWSEQKGGQPNFATLHRNACISSAPHDQIQKGPEFVHTRPNPPCQITTKTKHSYRRREHSRPSLGRSSHDSFTNHYALTGTTLTWSSTGPQSETPSVTLVW
jgi:D-alanyl-D-alanine carboxypeptidase